MTGSAPAFSILMTSFNYGRYIAAAIDSVLAQDFTDWQLLIVDDGSSDDSWAIAQAYRDRRILAFRQSSNQGACAAYNRALSQASGRYIASLDSDDFYLPGTLGKLSRFLAQNPEVDVCGSFISEVDAQGNDLAGSRPFADWFNVNIDLNDPGNWLWENRLCHSSTVIRAEMHRKIGGFDSALTYTPDWQFWIRALVQGARFAVIREPLVAYRNHGGNITHKDPASVLAEHSQTLGDVLLPWLAACGRADLIERSLRTLARRLALLPDDQGISRTARLLFSGNSALPNAEVALGILVSNARAEENRRQGAAASCGDAEATRVRLRELEVSSAWHAQQSANWESLAAEKEKLVLDLRSRLQEASQGRSEAEAKLRAVRRHWAVRFARRITRSRIL